MKKTDFRLLITVLLLAGLSFSCTREPGFEDIEEGAEGIRLSFSCTAPQTRAGTDGTKEGENNWNENLINTLDLFFYPEDKTNEDCVLHKRVSNLNDNDGEVSVTTYTTDQFVRNTLVPNSSTAFHVYSVANYPGTIVADESNLTGTSVDELKALPLVCDFSAATNHLQSSFVMDGLAKITGVEKDKRIIAKGSVSLKRVAAKITVQLNIQDQIFIPKTREVDDVIVHYDEVWEPMTNGLQLYIENAVKNTTLAALPVNNPTYFSYSGNRMLFTKSTNAEDADYPYITDPTYVYPQHWEYASSESPTKEPTLKLLLPWKRLPDDENNVTSTQKMFYYKIIIPDDTREQNGDDTYLKNFVRNNWYRFKMNIAMLGSETDGAAVNAEGHYFVVNWQDKDVVIKDAIIGAARFLSLEPKEYVLHNIPDLDMKHTSSHPVAINISKGSDVLDVTATRAYYGKENAGASYAGGTIRSAGNGHADYANGQKYIEYSASQRKALNNGEDWLKVAGEYIKFYHELNNDINDPNVDTSPYIIHFNLYHADHYNDAVYIQHITITQYPALCITAETSNGRVFVNSTSGQAGSDVDVSPLGSITSRNGINDSGDNTNPRQYTVTVTVLPADSDFIIGDPRTDGSQAVVTTVTNLNSAANYRPASTDARNIIAPIIRIASSYGKTTNVNYDNARARCAAYQENGYPAGRWRLPTYAEVVFLITLSQKAVIPTLFAAGAKNTGGYTCADGVVYPLPDGSIDFEPTANAASFHAGGDFPRCVYDEWYWGSEKDSSHMTSWGGFQTTK